MKHNNNNNNNNNNSTFPFLPLLLIILSLLVVTTHALIPSSTNTKYSSSSSSSSSHGLWKGNEKVFHHSSSPDSSTDQQSIFSSIADRVKSDLNEWTTGFSRVGRALKHTNRNWEEFAGENAVGDDDDDDGDDELSGLHSLPNFTPVYWGRHILFGEETSFGDNDILNHEEAVVRPRLSLSSRSRNKTSGSPRPPSKGPHHPIDFNSLLWNGIRPLNEDREEEEEEGYSMRRRIGIDRNVHEHEHEHGVNDDDDTSLWAPSVRSFGTHQVDSNSIGPFDGKPDIRWLNEDDDGLDYPVRQKTQKFRTSSQNKIYNTPSSSVSQRTLHLNQLIGQNS